MATQTAQALQAEVEIAQPTPYKWTNEQYDRMIEVGILKEDERVELIRGEIVEMAPIGLPHEACVIRLTKLFEKKFGEVALVSVQNSILLPNTSRPQPDITLLRWRDDFYLTRRPTPEDVILLIEVSDSTLADDRAEKVPLYAEAGVSEVWLVNLRVGAVEVYSEPAEGIYRSIRQAQRGEALSLPGGLEGAVTVDEVLG